MQNKMTSPKTYTLFLTFSVILSYASCSSILDKFLSCLPQNSKAPNNPIEHVVHTRHNSSFSPIFHFYARNARVLSSGHRKPLAIIAATSDSHVQATVICAKSHRIQIRTRSGGHDYEGLSYISEVPFVILDMFNLRRISINVKEETAVVQVGASLGDLYYAIAHKSKVHAFPGGVCPTMGVGGHFSGGGYGNLMRKYGLTIDNIIDAKLVDVNGRILNRKTMGEDVFWAIRGGGGASFGVILSWKIKLVSVPKTVTVFKVSKTVSEGAVDVVHRWQYVASKLPKELFIRAEADLDHQGQNGTRVIVPFIGMFLGKKATLLPLMNRSFPELGLKQSDCTEMSWINSTMFWAGLPPGTPYEALKNRTYPPNYSKNKSDYVKKPMSKKAIESIYKMMVDSNKIGMQWNPYGGRMAEIPESETPFPHRKGNLFKIQYWISWQKNEDKNSKKYMEAIRKLYEAMTPYVSKSPREAFLNYRDLDIGQTPSRHTSLKDAAIYGAKQFKGNYKRLMRAKTIIDPTNYFNNEQSIPALHSLN